MMTGFKVVIQIYPHPSWSVIRFTTLKQVNYLCS